MHDPDERDVVDLVDHVQARVAGDGGLELAGEVGQLRVADEAFLDLGDDRRRVDDLVGGDARDGAAEESAGVSPQAVVVSRPTLARRRQISGTSSISTQWYWMFSRSLMSAVPRARSVEIPPSTRNASAFSTAPSVRTRNMK
ncbi:hypothetical protein GCM10025883_31670 [Mobilicoccus caccae]|uniref:Uncharacterized protein n=1 Tax=Mobilicoccus caccae TaxID=1859295 RepID=A0ABQ6IWL0_9MICO|nr:hypothetical protein GCM10025883_31670 [Mobilicoccus caccae]